MSNLNKALDKVELPAIMTAEEVAKFLRLPLKTTRGLLHDGTLKGKKIGKHWRVTKENLERFLK
jgi:excisionase family DNA binding protein